MTTGAERFLVEGNALRVTERFDPRFQPRSAAELLRILRDLLLENADRETVLDLVHCSALPSMMLGCLAEAKQIAQQAGRSLRIRLRDDHYRQLESLGVWQLFERGDGAAADGAVCQELIARPAPADDGAPAARTDP